MTAAKAWLSLVGGLLTVLIPVIVQMSASLPPPWPSIIGAIVAILTAFGVYQVPNKTVTPIPPVADAKPWPKP